MALYLSPVSSLFPEMEQILDIIPAERTRMPPTTLEALLGPYSISRSQPRHCFETTVPLDDFKPSEVDWKADKSTRMVTITGKNEEKLEDGQVVGRRYMERSIYLPQEFNIEAVQIAPYRHGYLKITAPRNQPVDDGKTTLIAVDASEGFKPDDISMEVDKENRLVKVTGKSEQVGQHGSVFSSRHFERSFRLPEHYSLEDVAMEKQADGSVAIRAPKISEKKPPAKGRSSDDSEEAALFDTEVLNQGGPEYKLKVHVGSPMSAKDLQLQIDPSTKALTVQAGENKRSFTIPEEFDLERMSSVLSEEEGVLYVTAPKKEEKTATAIPIKRIEA